MSYARDSKGLPGLGWDCSKCGAFNGDMKEQLKACRCCSAPRPGSPADLLARDVEDLETSVRLGNFLRDQGCKTVADAYALQRDESKWMRRKKNLRELRELLKNIGVLT